MSRGPDGRWRKSRIDPLLLLTLLGTASVVLSTPALAQDVDITAPTLVDMSFTPTTIDVSGGPQTVVVTLTATDDLSGMTSFSVSFRSPTFAQSQFANGFLTSGTDLDGTFTANMVFPQFSETGTWVISNIHLRDRVGNFTNFDTNVLVSRGLPTDLMVISTPDTEAPLVTDVIIAPGTIDVSTGAAVIDVTLEITDNLSGVTFSTCVAGGQPSFFFPVTLISPSGVQQRFTPSNATTLAAGTPQDGFWHATFTMPQYSEAGTWEIQSIQVVDCARNFGFLSSFELTTLGLQRTLDVTSAQQDLQQPAATSLSVSPISINTATGFQFVTVQMGVSDNLSGASFLGTTPQLTFFEAGLQFRSPSGQQTRGICCGSFNLISGTPLNGVWQSSLFFPQFSEDGTWRIDFFNIKDAVRNVRNYTEPELAALGFPTTIEVIRPSLIGDGTVGAAGGTVIDDSFGPRASITFPAGALPGNTNVAIDVFPNPLAIPNPTGFDAPGTHFVNIELTPPPPFPLPPPGMTIVLPLPNPLPAGTVLSLYKIDTLTGLLVPAIDVFGMNATGLVDAAGTTATFSGIASLSTVVGLIPTAPELQAVEMDLTPATVSLANTTMLNAILLSNSSFDATTVSLGNVRMLVNGAEVAPATRRGQVISSVSDWNGDGLPDRLIGFRVADLVAAGLTTTASSLILQDIASELRWAAVDPSPPNFVH